MSSKYYISEEEFDRLPPESQRRYYYCPDCGMYYLKEETEICVCKFPD